MKTETPYKLICPTCKNVRYFCNKYTLKKAENKQKCNKCSHGNLYLKVKHLIKDDKSKNCPKCGNIQYYKRNETYYRALINNTSCNSCKDFTDEHKKNMSISRNKRNMLPEYYEKRKKTIKERYPNGIKKSKESIQKTVDGLQKWRELNPDKEIERIKKSRKSLLDNYGEYFSSLRKPTYNKNACGIFNKINSELGWNGFHAENNKNGEYVLRINDYDAFYLDYYEPNKNVVIEYDEPYHFKPSTDKKYHKRRESLIKKTLHCEFYRLKYSDDVDLFLENLKLKYGIK